MVGIYIASLAGSTGRERELAHIKNLALDHSNACGDLLSSLHEICLDGPKTEAELGARMWPTLVDDNQLQSSCEVGLAMTDFSRELAKHWVERFGRRFRLYAERRDKGQVRGHRKDSEAALVSSQRLGRRRLAEGHGEDKAILGFTREKLKVPVHERARQYQLSDLLRQFRKTTADRKAEASARNSKIALRQDAYPVGDVRLGCLFAGASAGETTMSLGRGQSSHVVLNLCASREVTCIPGTKLEERGYLHINDIQKVMARARRMKIVLVETWADLDHGGKSSTTPLAPKQSDFYMPYIYIYNYIYICLKPLVPMLMR